MKKTNNKKWIFAGGGGLVLVAVLIIALFQWPANQFTMDVNPSLEITTNQLDNVIEIKALNEDAKEFLDGYEREDNDLEDVINDLVDRMILTGHISGGQDNVVMISVEDEELNSAYLEKVNEAIAAFLQNKQLEYRILNQGLTEADMDEENNDDENQNLDKVSRGKRTLIQKLMEENDGLTMEELNEISLGDLLRMAEEMNISPKELFARSIDSPGDNDDDDRDDADYDDDDKDSSNEEREVIGRDAAVQQAKEKAGGGNVTAFEYDRDDGVYEIELEYNGFEYEFEINAYTGAIIEMERDEMDDDDDRDDNDDADDDDSDDTDDDDDDDSVGAGDSSYEARTVIGRDRAVNKAIEKAGGGTVEEFDFDRDEGEYEISIIFNGYEYEFEIDAYTGNILDMEREQLDDDDDDKDNPIDENDEDNGDKDDPTDDNDEDNGDKDDPTDDNNEDNGDKNNPTEDNDEDDEEDDDDDDEDEDDDQDEDDDDDEDDDE